MGLHSIKNIVTCYSVYELLARENCIIFPYSENEWKLRAHTYCGVPRVKQGVPQIEKD